MESRDMAPHEAYPILETRAKRATLHLDPPTFVRRVDDDYPPDSANSSPNSASTTLSPVTPLVNRPLSRSSEPPEPEDEKEPASGPQRARSVSSAKSEKEKRKRSRVTPEQLIHLERFFSVDRSPTAARRREISELLGMQERQTQIWFQNRRAKAKLQDGKHKGRSGSDETPPDTPPELSTGFEVDLHNLIHEDEPVTIIPCTDLSIGTWRRIATTVGKHDLVAYVCDAKRCLTWFIHSAGYGFKMEIPFDTIVDTEFTNAAPGSGLASFVLSHPPVFYLENVTSPRPDGSVMRHWKRCADWTEGHQATNVLRHDLIGSAVQLAHVLRNLHTNTPGSDIPLHSPSYRTEPPTPPMELPQPPMAGLSGPGFHYRNDSLASPRPDHHEHNRKRSYSGPAPLSHPPPLTDFPSGNGPSRALHTAPSGSFPPSSYSPVSGRSIQPSSNFTTPLYGEYSGPEQNSIVHHSQSINEYGSVAISHGIAPRPYSAQPVPRTFYGEEPRLVQPYHGEGMRRHSSANLSQQYGTGSPSPPLLTTPYHPPPHLTENMANSHGESLGASSTPVISGLPGVPYETDDDIHRLQEDTS